MRDKMVIMFPDYRAEGSLGEFGQTLLEKYGADGSVVLIPVINGFDDKEQQAQAVGKLSQLLRPIIVDGNPGQLHALRHGYEAVKEGYPLSTVVRMDTNEHPIEMIPVLAHEARACGGMAIANLKFGPGLVTPGSPEELFLAACPVLYGKATTNLLPLSGAHGFQAFAPDMLADIYEAAEEIVDRAHTESGPRLRWGLCGAMAMGAVGIDVPVKLIDLEAAKSRNRPAEKIAAQLIDFTRTVIAAVKIYDYDEP